MSSSNVRPGRAAAACFAFLLTLQPALASDSLDRLLGVLPDIQPQAGQSPVFDFADPRVAPPAGAGAYTPMEQLRLRISLADPARARALTGVDFGRVDGLLVVGQAQTQVTALTGAAGFAAGLDGALEARGFQRHRRSGGEAFAFGEDNTLDLRRMPDDPLRSWTDASQRLMLLGPVLVGATHWPAFDVAIANLAQPPGRSVRAFRALNRAISSGAGDGSSLVAGFGLDVQFFSLPATPPPTGTSRPSEVLALRPPLRIVMPPWTYALVGVVRRGEQERVVVALHYEVPSADARRGLATVAARLIAWKPEYTVPTEGLPLSAVEQRIVPVDGGTVGVWSASVKDGERGAALRLLIDWRRSALLSDFAALNLTE